MLIELNLFRPLAPGIKRREHFVHVHPDADPLKSYSTTSLLTAARCAYTEATCNARAAYVRVNYGSLETGEISLTTEPRALYAVALLVLAVAALLWLLRLPARARFSSTQKSAAAR
jgi:hypothetical protein